MPCYSNGFWDNHKDFCFFQKTCFFFKGLDFFFSSDNGIVCVCTRAHVRVCERAFAHTCIHIYPCW